MKIVAESLSVVVGTTACMSACPFCVANMTYDPSKTHKAEFNIDAYKKALAVAKSAAVNTVLITGKGEPLIWPDIVEKSIFYATSANIPIVEIQTNGVLIPKLAEKFRVWSNLGLTTVCLSRVSMDDYVNSHVYSPRSPDTLWSIKDLTNLLHDMNLSVRVSLVLTREHYPANKMKSRLNSTIDRCKEIGVDQLTIRSVETPSTSNDVDTLKYASENKVFYWQRFIKDRGTRLLRLSFGAEVYDVGGQNVCISNCLTIDEEPDTIRSLIFFPDGHLRYSWDYPGAIIF